MPEAMQETIQKTMQEAISETTPETTLASAKANLNNFACRGQFQAKLCFKSYYCIYYPQELIETNIRCKTLIWANGTFAVPWIYHGLLKHMASWGYVVIASWSPFTQIDQIWLNGGVRMCRNLNDSDSLFKNLLDVENLGAFGHSQGGGVALQLSWRDDVKASVALQPAPFYCEKTKHPLLILTGSRDIFVWPFLVKRISFLSSKIKTFWLNHSKATHLMPLGNAGAMRAPTCAFFQWQLAKDEQAGFCFEDGFQNGLEQASKTFTESDHWKFEVRHR